MNETHKSIRIAIAGQPNAGKSSLFNALTGAHQHVANYPGVTVEKRVGRFRHEQQDFEVVDLPGSYALSSFTPEERVAQDELLGGDFDVVVVVVDSGNLSRSLVFLCQIMHVNANPVLCLNMADEARLGGQRLDLPRLESLLGFPVVETVGHRKEGLPALREAIARAAASPVASRAALRLGDRLEGALEAVESALVESHAQVHVRSWIASKLLAGERPFLEQTALLGASGEQAIAVAKREREAIEAETREDLALFVAARYRAFVEALLKQVLRRARRRDARHTSDRVDRVLVHRGLGVPIFLALMFLVFWLTFSVGEIPMGWMESGFAWLGEAISGLWAPGSPSPLRSLLVDGVIGGVGGVIVFLPNIVLLFLGLALLEDTGYMARAAFLVDRLMHRFGLHGQSFVPMLVGFGCSVPGILATRTLENHRDRLTTMLVLPLMSCGARLPIWMLLIPAFFPPAWRAPMLWLIYTIGVLLALGLALLLRRSLFRGQETPFVMELPPYRLPTVGAVLSKVGERSWLYVKKAGTVILAISMVMWFITSYPEPDDYAVAATSDAAAVSETSAEALAHARQTERLRHSLAGRIGRAVEPLIAPLGFDWKLGTAMIGAFAAKEVFVAQMGIVYSLGEGETSSETLREALARDYSPLAGFSLMLFLLIATPCMATVAATRKESGRWRWALFQLFGLTATGYLASLVVYQVGRLLG